MASVWGFAGDTQAANTELFLNLPLTAAALLVATADRRGLWLLGAGALTGLAALFKYQAGLVGAAWACVVFFGRAERLSRRMLELGLLAAGFGLVAAVFLGAYALTGRLDAMLFWGWAFNFQYMSTLDAAEVLKNVVQNSALTVLFWSPLLLLLGRVDRAALRLLLPWTLLAGLAVAAGGRFFLHYYLMALPPVCLLAAVGALGPAPWRQRAARIAAGLVTILSLVFAWGYYAFKPGLAGFDQRYRTVAAWIALNSRGSDRIFVWGNSPEVYYYADRVMGTRFPFCNYHTGRIWGSPFHDQIHIDGTEAHIVPRAWDELSRDLQTDPPELIVDAAAGKLDRFDDHPIQRYKMLHALVEEGYTRVAEVDGVPIYRRR